MGKLGILSKEMQTIVAGVLKDIHGKIRHGHACGPRNNRQTVKRKKDGENLTRNGWHQSTSPVMLKVE